MALGKDETGSLRLLLDGVRQELETVGMNNIDLAQRIRSNLETPLQNFITDQRDQRKLTKEKYYTECAKMINLQNSLETCMAGREYEKIKQKHEKSRLEVKTTDKEYQAACTGLKNLIRQWQHEWKVASDKFQEMEEKRIEFLHHSLCVYVNILQTVTDQERESHERIWERLDQCDVEKDIEHFIETHGTGGHIPEPPAYVDFFSETRDDQPKYSIAHFSGRRDSKRESKRSSSSNIYQSKSEDESRRSSSKQSHHQSASNRLSLSLERESRQLSNGDEEIFIEDTAQGVIVPVVTKKNGNVETTRSMTQSSDDVFHTTERPIAHERGDLEHTNSTNSKQSFVSRLSRKLSQNLDRSFDQAIEGLKYKMDKGRESTDVEYGSSKASARSNSYRRAPSPTRNSSSSSASKTARSSSPYVPGGWPNSEPKVSLSTSAKVTSDRTGAVHSPSPSYSAGTNKGAKGSADSPGSIKMHAPPAMRKPAQQAAVQAPSQEKQVASHDGGEPILCWAIALFDYHAKYDDDLNFERGDWFAITQMDEGGWYMAHAWNATEARWVGRYGYVPSNFLQPAK
ncbi:hypothetical protein INT43_007051 [Umbelopsis isabellina]|uniref:SH3 domain-containing protein n=1 Tax=Mortierella isabellina TaxID=91625 RepID=A0A8H7UKE2_MORIS|nr:hypothetical protein INT43_007051 [Umbelopsis isabellina]